MNKIHIQYFKTTFGELIIGSLNEYLCLCDWRYRKMRLEIDDRIQSILGAKYSEENSDIIKRTIDQLQEYFNKERQEFTIPLQFAGTDFQKRVWEELLKIPYGKTETYMGLTQRLGDEKAIRAVASANGANAVSIIVPCHRIIGSKGDLTGYAGGIRVKRKLLQLENYERFPEQMDLFKAER